MNCKSKIYRSLSMKHYLFKACEQIKEVLPKTLIFNVTEQD